MLQPYAERRRGESRIADARTNEMEQRMGLRGAVLNGCILGAVHRISFFMVLTYSLAHCFVMYVVQLELLSTRGWLVACG